MSEFQNEDKRRRSDRNGRFPYTCASCGRFFLSRRNLASMAGARVSVCGAILDPPQAHCLLEDGLGNRWWPKNRPMPDLLELQREAEAARAD
jgi:uncharacterized OB-fold protein